MKTAFIFCAALFVALESFAQMPPDPVQTSADPFRKVGQMFTVTIRPGAKRIEVQVVGNDVASANFTNLNVLASLKVGKKEWVITPQKNQGQFIVETPADISSELKSELRLEVRDSDKKENFNFKINRRKP